MTWESDHAAIDQAVAQELLSCIRRAQELRALLPESITRGWKLWLYEDQLLRSMAHAEDRPKSAAPSASPAPAPRPS